MIMTTTTTTTATSTTTIFLVSLTAMTGFFGCVSSTTKVEVCNRDTQLLSCGGSDVINIDSARIGRMSTGTCLSSPNQLNCSTDVALYLEHKCAGRRQCNVGLDATLDNSPHGCHPDLKTYLEIFYSCIPVESPKIKCNDSSYVIQPKEPSGYLARVATIETGIGSGPSCPWVIEVKSGQTLALTLLDFGIWRLANQSGDGRSMCHIYMIVKDRVSTGSPMRICGGTKVEERKRESFFTSVANSVQITVNTGDDQFLVKYEVIGCPDLSPTPSHSSVERNGNSLTIRCDEWKGGRGGGGGKVEPIILTCVNGSWTGPALVNCSAAILENSDKHQVQAQTSFQGVLMVVVVAAVVVIVILVATVAIFVLWRQRLLKQRSEEVGGGVTVPLTDNYPFIPGTATAYFDPTFPGPRHYAVTPSTAPTMLGGGLRLLQDGSRRPSAELLHQLDYSTLQAQRHHHHPGALPKNLGHSASFSSFRQLPGVAAACAETPYNGANTLLMYCPYHGTITRVTGGQQHYHDPRGGQGHPGGCAAHPLSHSHEDVVGRCHDDYGDDENQFQQQGIYHELDPNLLSPDPRC